MSLPFNNFLENVSEIQMRAICCLQYSILRTAPEHKAEWSSQLVWGEWVLVSEFGQEWSLVTTEHGYSGWCRSAHLFIPSGDAYNILETSILMVSTRNAKPLLWPDFFKKFPTPEKHVAGCFGFFPKEKQVSTSGWTKIENPSVWNPDKAISEGRNLLNVPYVWGGKTPVGFDCSGFIQHLFHIQGFSFPRDAWQQAESGTSISFIREKPEFEPGILLFFQRPGKKIHHVALSLGRSQIMHASEWVRIESLDPQSPDFVFDRWETLVSAKKIEPADLEPLALTFRKLWQFA